MSGKGVELILFQFDSHSSLTATLTNMKLGREIKLDEHSHGCKQCISRKTTKKQSRPIHFDFICMCM